MEISHTEVFDKILAADSAIGEPMSQSQVLARSLGRSMQAAIEARDRCASECKQLQMKLAEAQADLQQQDRMHSKLQVVFQEELGALKQRNDDQAAALEEAKRKIRVLQDSDENRKSEALKKAYEEIERLKSEARASEGPSIELQQALTDVKRYQDELGCRQTDIRRLEQQLADKNIIIAQLRDRVQECERQLEQVQRRMDDSGRLEESRRRERSRLRSAACMARVRSVADAHRRALSLGGELLVGSTDGFVLRVREEQATAAAILEKAYEAQLGLIADTLAEQTETDPQQRVMAWNHMDGLVEAADRLTATLHELSALQHECRVQHQLPPGEMELVYDHIAGLRREIAQELAELKNPLILAGLPLHILQGLREVQRGVHCHDEAPQGHLALLPWLHESRRRALVHFVLRRDFADIWQPGNPAAMTSYMPTRATVMTSSEPLSVAFACLAGDQRGARGDVPAHIRDAIRQAEALGWGSLVWKKGVTLLHWAAKEGRPDLCRRFLRLCADPSARDDTGRTPMDLAVSEAVRAALLEAC